VLLAGVAIRGFAIAFLPHTPESDELAYLSMASNLLHGKGIVDHMGNLAMYNMGYPSFILWPAFGAFGENLLVAKLGNLFLGCISIVLCYCVAQAAGANRTGRILAALIWAVYLPASVYGVYLAKENLMVPLMLGLMWCALRMLDGASTRIALIAGILLGTIALTGNAALSLVGAVFFAVLLARQSLVKKLVSAAIMLALAAVVVTPWLMRNAEMIGKPVLNTNGGFNLYLGNNPAATGWFVSISDTPRGASWNELRKSGEIQASDTLKTDAMAWIKENPKQFISLALKKAVFFWTPPVHEAATPMSFSEKMVRWVWAFQFIAITLIALAGLAYKDLRSRKTLVLWLALLGYTAAHMLFYVIFRYREPVMPIFAVLAALSVGRFWRGPLGRQTVNHTAGWRSA
jgi:4-amino-4-deoxy-L-arabinose transferase-like glycosyltransferase